MLTHCAVEDSDESNLTSTATPEYPFAIRPQQHPTLRSIFVESPSSLDNLDMDGDDSVCAIAEAQGIWDDACPTPMIPGAPLPEADESDASSYGNDDMDEDSEGMNDLV